MLILTRRNGESLMIGENVTVTILAVKGNQVRIGIDAPRDVMVHRKEIYERIQRGEGPRVWHKPAPEAGARTCVAGGMPSADSAEIARPASVERASVDPR